MRRKKQTNEKPVPSNKHYVLPTIEKTWAKASKQKGIYFIYNTKEKEGYVEITGFSMGWDVKQNYNKYLTDGYVYATDPDYSGLSPMEQARAMDVFTRFDGKPDPSSIVYLILKPMGNKCRNKSDSDQFRKSHLSDVEAWRKEHVVAVLKETIERLISERKTKAKAKRAMKKPSPNSDPNEPFVWHGM